MENVFLNHLAGESVLTDEWAHVVRSVKEKFGECTGHMLFDGVATGHQAAEIVFCNRGAAEWLVDVLHDAVKDAAEEAVLDVFGDFLFLLEPEDGSEAEAHGAVDIVIDGAGRKLVTAGLQVGVEGVKYLARLFDTESERIGGGDGEGGRLFDDRRLVVIAQLMDKAADFARRAEAVCAGVIEKGDAAGARDHAVKVVGKDAVAMLEGGQAEAVAQRVGDERWRGAAGRKEALVHGEDDEAIKVKDAGLKHTHDL